MDNSKRAEKIHINHVCDKFGHNCQIFIKAVTSQLEEAVEEAEERVIEAGKVVAAEVYEKGFAEGFAAARDQAAGILKTLGEVKQKCSSQNDQHDDRWCPTCEAMEDAYSYAEARIRTMRPGEEGK